jgi:DNA-directed RNA polymerase subunit L
MKVDNIVYGDNSINYKKSRFADIIKQNLDILPTLTHKYVSFDLIDSNEAFANAIRRIMTNELEILTFYVDMKNVITDDKYILPDLVKDRLEMIPLNQSVDENTKFSLRLFNKSGDILNVETNDIKHNSRITPFNNMLLCQLNNGCFLEMNNISIKTQSGMNDGKFSLCVVEYDEININKNEVRTLNHDSTDFKLTINTNGNIEFKLLFDKLFDSIERRLLTIKSNISNYDYNKKSFVIDNNFYIFKEHDITKYHINNEFHTIGNLLTKYIYQLDNTVDLVNYNITHILTKSIILNVKHPEADSLVLAAIDNIIADFKLFVKSF